MIKEDFDDSDRVPKLSNQKDITPAGMNWNEPGNFHPDGHTLLLTGSTEKNAQGRDQYTLDVRTGGLVNLTQSPKVWDEHGRFSPDGSRILFMSSYPYRSDPKSSQVLSIKTEFMVMNSSGGTFSRLLIFENPDFRSTQKSRG